MIDLIIAHKNLNPYRERNIKSIIKYYNEHLTDITIYVIEQNTNSNFSHIKNVKHTRLNTRGAFNKAKCYNVGYKISKSDKLMFVDADVIISESILENINNYFDYPEVTYPYDTSLCDLSDSESIHFIKTGEIKGGKFREWGGAGGAHFSIRDSYYAVGGYDEQFVGWGGEDSAYTYKSDKIVGVKWLKGSVYHLWHPSLRRPYSHYSKHYIDIINMSDEDLKNYIKKCQLNLK